MDFVCLKSRLVVEIDGGGHFEDERREFDSERTEELRARGFDVIRFSNHDVITNIHGVFQAIVDKLGGRNQ